MLDLGICKMTKPMAILQKGVLFPQKEHTHQTMIFGGRFFYKRQGSWLFFGGTVECGAKIEY